MIFGREKEKINSPMEKNTLKEISSPQFPLAHTSLRVPIKKVKMKVPAREIEEEEKKAYEFGFGPEDEKNTSTYKSRITYQISTQYASKGKYQVDSDEEEF